MIKARTHQFERPCTAGSAKAIQITNATEAIGTTAASASQPVLRVDCNSTTQ